MAEVETMDSSYCPKVLGVFGLLTDLWYPWVFGFYMPYDDSAGAGKICSIVFVVIWTVSAASSLVYMCVPDVKSQLSITICYFTIALAGAAMNIAGIYLSQNKLDPSHFTTQLSIILTFRLLHLVFVGTYLRQLRQISNQRDALRIIRLVNSYMET